MLQAQKQWPQSKPTIETGRRGSRGKKEKFYSHIAPENNKKFNQLSKSNMFETKIKEDKFCGSKMSEHQKIFKDSDSSFTR